jgi:hypothetical protein
MFNSHRVPTPVSIEHATSVVDQIPYQASEEVDDLERVLDDADSQELLAVVAAVHHHGVDETLNDGALHDGTWYTEEYGLSL